jgi:hypothetical protein
MPKSSQEYATYKDLEHWKPINEIILARDLSDKKDSLAPLFAYIYKKTKEAYHYFPDRKDGQDSFTHPLNLVLDLKKASITDYTVLCAGMLHDYVEEMVDLYKKENNIIEDKEGIIILDKHEIIVVKELVDDLKKLCKKKKMCEKAIDEIMALLNLLTRHKKHRYYRSISEIFNCKNKDIKEKAIQVKLADRIHNIQTLETFDSQGKVYQAFKNLFILNNTKRYLQEKYGDNFQTDKAATSTEKLFKKCCKATYDAFLEICHQCFNKGIQETESMLQLAFRKFAHEKGGLWVVTKLDPKERHPMRLYFEIVRKYDARLHQEFDKFDKAKEEEKDYCKKFFADFNFNDNQLDAIIGYKDAYALKEVVARLLYKSNYLISGFGCSELCSRRMVCMKL